MVTPRHEHDDTRSCWRRWLGLLPGLLPVLLVVLALTVSFLVWRWRANDQDFRGQVRFDAETEVLKRDFLEKLNDYQGLLRAGRGLVSHDKVSPEEWRRFGDSLDLKSQFKGLDGLGVVVPVSFNEYNAFLVRSRQSRPGFSVFPEPARDHSQELMITVLAVPDGASRAIGFDASSQPSRRSALERARDSGVAALTDRLTLVTAGGTGKDYVMYLAAYRDGRVPDSVEARRQHLAGWIAVAFNMSVLAEAVVGQHLDLDVDIFDGQKIADDHLLFDNCPQQQHAAEPKFSPRFARQITLTAGGSPFLLSIQSTPVFEAKVFSAEPQLVLGAGLLLSLMLGMVAHLLLRGREQALALAGTMTAALQASESRYRGLVETQQDLVVRFDKEGRFTFVNETLARAVGSQPDQMIGMPWHSLVHPDDIAETTIAIANTAKPPLYRANVENRMLMLAGERWYAWEGYGLIDDRQQLLEVQAVGRDITERQLRERQLRLARNAAESASQAKSRFLAVMSHELRTPLNAILGFSELIRDQSYGPVGCEQYLEYADHIHVAGQHLLTLINDILDLSKIEAGRMEIEPVLLKVSHVMSDAMRLVRVKASMGGLSLVCEATDPELRLWADERAIKQMLFNLLANAVKFTPHGGTVKLAARAAGPMVHLEVIDTGIGIPPEDLPRVMKPFEQIDNRFSRSRGGTGLGLSLVQGLVGLHHGRLLVVSRVGEGTTFTLELPQQQPNESL